MATQTERIVIDVGADITKARAAMGELKKIFNSTDLGADQSKKITSMFSELGRNLDQLERKSSTALTSLGEAQAVKKVKDNVQDLITGIADEFQKIKGLGNNELVKNFVGMADGIKSSTKAFKAYDEALDKITADEKKAEAQANKTAKAYQDASKSQREISKFRKDLNEPSLTGKGNSVVSKFLEDQVNALKVANDDAQKRLQDFLSKNNLDPNDVLNQSGTANKSWVKKNGQLGTDLQDVAQQAVEAGNKFSEAQKKYSDFQDLLSKRVGGKELADLKKQADDAKQAFDNLVGNRSQLSESAFNNLKKSLSDIFGADLFKNITNSSNAVQQFQNAIKNFQTDKIQQLKKQFPEIENLLNDLGNSAKTMGDEVNGGVEKFSRLKEASTEVEHLSSRLKYFFSLAGGFNLMRRAIRDAVNTTKELDAVMTQTAVVSQNTVADMWKTLPQYSKEAKKLGAEIKDVYSAQTLYVQQGLDMNSAMDLGVETLKMARVAGIDAAEATNSMTAALRGFNMELNEASAQRVNDVYSKLAQNTASDVKEISTAMSKVAALANSANMSFENTSAFLATIIESTREGAETAGTALKTVIARFSEVKKLYSEGDLIGSDEEGQEIDVNKIGTALRTAGINMNEFFLGTKGLDEIFKELGSKWSSLTTVQQRYIATQAAGSRQQSRFLALMQNYSRTLELTEMAYNSAGSGQEQFEKTLDSLASKINILKDEWNTFIMGIANSDLIKGFIDTGTTILTTINNIIDAISGGNGLIKSIASIATAIGIFKGGGAILKGSLGRISDIFKGAGKDAQKGFFNGLTAATKGTVAGQRGQAGAAFVGNYLKNAFTYQKSEIENVKFNSLRLGLQNSMQGPQSFMGTMGNEFNAYQDAVNNHGANSNEAVNSLQNLQQAAEKAGISQKEFSNILQQNSTQINKTKMSIQGLGNAALLAGGLLIGLGAALESTGAISKEWASVIKGAGIALVTFGGVLKITGAAVQAFSGEATAAISSIPIIGWVAAAIAALTALSVVLYNTFSMKARANAAEQYAEETKAAAEKVKQEYDNIQQKIEEIGSQQNAFEDLIVGTEEWNTAVKDLNQSLMELLQLYPELAGAVEYVDGHLQLNTKSEEYQNWINQKQQEVEKTQTAAAAANYYNQKIQGQYAAKGYTDNIGEYDKVYNEGLRSRLEANNVSDIIIDELLQGIYSGTIFNKESLNDFTKSLTKEQQRNISNAFQVESTRLNENWDDYGLYTATVEQYSEDYTERFINAEKQRNRTQDRANWVQPASQIIENKGLNDSEFSNLWLAIAEQQINDLVNGENLTEETSKALDKEISKVRVTTNKADYAKSIGKKENEVDQKEYENYLRVEAAKRTVSNTNLTEGFQDLSTNELAQAEALVRGNLSKLTLEQLKTLGEFNFDLVKDYSSVSQESAAAAYGKLFNGFEKYQEDIEKVAGSVDQVETYKNLIPELRKSGVSDTGIKQLFGTLQSEVLNKTTKENKEEVQSLLGAIDFTSRDSIRNGISQIKALGIAVGDDLVNSLIDATNAVKTFSETKLSEKLEGLEDTKAAFEKIASGESKTITQKQYEAAEKAGYEFGEDWIKTGTKEWTYVGNETNSLLTNIDSLVAVIAADLKSSTEDAVNKGTAIAEIVNNKTKFADTVDNAEITKAGYDTLENIINAYVKAIEENPEFANNGVSKKIAAAVGLSENATVQDVVDVFNEYYGPEGAAYNANQEMYKQFQEKYGTQFAASLSNGQAILNATQKEGYEGEDRFLEEKDANKALNITLEQSDQEYIEYIKQLLNFSKDYDNILKALTVDSKKARQNFDDLSKTYKDNAQNLVKENKGTQSYLDSLFKLTAATKKAFGNNKAITADFVENHLEDFEKMSEGSEEALDNIRTALKTDLQNSIQKGTAEADALNKAIGILDQADFSIGGTFDASNIINNLNLTEEQANEVAKKLNELGWSADIEVTGYDELTKVPLGYRLVVKDTAGEAIKEKKQSGGGGGGGGGKEFKNEFDKYYNQVEDINELERLRNLLESDYNQLLKNEVKSGKDIYDNLKRQLGLLEERRVLTADLAEKRKQQIFETMEDAQYQSVRQYANWNNTDLTIEIDWDAINKVKDTETGDLIKEYVKKLEDFQSKYDEQIEALEDIEDAVQDIKERGREEYTSLEDRTRDALIKQIQDKIDELTAVDEAINDANQKLFDSISQTLELQRQDRDNAQTEEELTDKEKRLAYLQQDSSNANAVEIAKLQEELADARQDYTDTLIDQRISELQRQNDEAQEQRQQQIELMQQSLEWEEKAGVFWDEVYRLISEGTDVTGSLVKASELEQLLKNGEAWDSLSEEGKMKWLEELEDIVAQGLAYLELSRQLEDVGTKAGTSITFTTADGKTLTGTVDKNGNVVVKDANGGSTTYKDVYQDYHGAYKTYETAKEAAGTNKPTTSTSGATSAAGAGSGEAAGSWALIKNGEGIVTKIWGRPGNSGPYKTYKEAAVAANQINNGIKTDKQKEIDGLKQQYIALGNKAATGIGTADDIAKGKNLETQINYLENKLKTLQIPAFKTGGVADFTGPAWLDGTKSRPELVLNARDTENFIQLKDTLADMKRSSESFGSKGDVYFDIDVQVDQMNSDYDVDQAIDRIKARIVQDGAYRNVNTLSRLR